MTPTREFEHDLLRALQYTYYTMGVSLVSDQQYDTMQRAYEDQYETSFPVGSDSARDYTRAEEHLAYYLEARGLPIS